jgi:hypothetical protein
MKPEKLRDMARSLLKRSQALLVGSAERPCVISDFNLGRVDVMVEMARELMKLADESEG